MSLVQEYALEHSELGEIVGLARGNDLVQFRRIPFADIPARFRQSKLRTTLPEQPFDATQPGPACPQLAFPEPALYSGPLPPDAIKLQARGFDEFACLSLNISSPRSALSEPLVSNLPVLVYIHGGGLVAGSSSQQSDGREVFDTANLVRSAEAMGKPIVAVSINYRLGPLGFLASKELAAFNKSFGEAVGNYGLHDQRQALEWISRFIAGFGGDPTNVTIEGGSAGGLSCHYQAVFPDRKLKRAICNSGTTLTLAALPLAYHQKIFDDFAKKWASGSKDAVQNLQSVPVSEICNGIFRPTYTPVIDNVFIKGRLFSSYQDIPDLPELLVGSSRYEDDVVLGILDMVQPPTNESIQDQRSYLTRVNGLTDNEDDLFSADILELYGIDSVTKDMETHVEQWAELVGHIAFNIPALAVAANHTTTKTVLYEFQATNPYQSWGPGYGKANHAIADIFLLNAAPELVPEAQRADYDGAVRRLQADWIAFCYGELDLEPFRVGDKDLGPIYKYGNGGTRSKAEALEDAVGEDRAAKWKTILSHCKI